MPDLEEVPGRSADEELDNDETALERDVKVTDQRDVNELLRLSNPLKPTLDMRLTRVTLSDGTKIEEPTVQDLKQLRPSRLTPVIFHWRDRTRAQTRAPKQYDEIIQRLLNSGPAEMEELVRANWKMFDRAFFFRLTELREDAVDEGLKGRISALYSMAVDIVKAAREDMRRKLPSNAKDVKDILNAMLESDGDTLLWPAPPEAYARLAECISTRATRAKYEDNWFETTIEIVERYVKKMEVQQKEHLFWMGKIVLQRLVTEWLRHDSLWEETDEGRFLFRLMSISHEQWADQLRVELAPLDVNKLRDELKIIGENKVVQLPMGSKLQVYAAKYIQGLAEFVVQKDKLLQQMQEMEGREA